MRHKCGQKRLRAREGNRGTRTAESMDRCRWAGRVDPEGAPAVVQCSEGIELLKSPQKSLRRWRVLQSTAGEDVGKRGGRVAGCVSHLRY